MSQRSSVDRFNRSFDLSELYKILYKLKAKFPRKLQCHFCTSCITEWDCKNNDCFKTVSNTPIPPTIFLSGPKLTTNRNIYRASVHIFSGNQPTNGLLVVSAHYNEIEKLSLSAALHCFFWLLFLFLSRIE